MKRSRIIKFTDGIEIMEFYIEKLFAEFLVWYCGLASGERYEALLNKYFLMSRNSDILMELEESSHSSDDTREVLSRFLNYDYQDFDNAEFGKTLMKRLKNIYDTSGANIDAFDECCFRLWRELPEDLLYTEPFITLSYAGDFLSWDEQRTRRLYKEAFEYYN